MSVTLNSSGGGSVTLTPANTAVGTTATVPATTGSVLIAPAAATVNVPAITGDIAISGTTQLVAQAQYYKLSTAVTGANATGVQSIYGVGVAVVADTVYEFEMVFTLSKAAGLTTHVVNLAFGGTAVINNISYTVVSPYTIPPAPTLQAANIINITTTAATTVTGAIATGPVSLPIIAKGTLRVSTGGSGTLIPQYSLSAAPGAAYTTAVGGYCKIYPIGTGSSNISIGTWA